MRRPYNFIKSIVKDNYELFKDLMPYQEAMARAINTVLEPIEFSNIFHPTITFNSKDEIKDLLLAELQYDVNINQGVEAGDYHTLTDNTDHIAWYREKVAADAINFKFWKRYKKYLLNIKGWNVDTVNRLDEITDDIIERIEDPTNRNRAFDRRGLVVGYVQSGKTANFTGVINKAIDSGYRVIVVLSGMHKNLRSQTQMRIDEEVIGRDTSDHAQVKRIGVTTLPNEGYINVDTFTTQDDNGDFTRAFAQQIGGIQPGSDRPMLLVVKKNASVLRNLIRYFRECLDTLGDEYVLRLPDNSIILNNLPLLLIDDEADQASPDTKPPSNDIDGELDPSTINRNIRELLNLFNQKAYVGYTATPFANIFIHHENEHSLYRRDLFPSSFIISMEAQFEDGIPYIIKIENWQVVNGGQTTASIFATSTEKESDLSKVFVQMKISVIQKKEEMENIVPKISRFANTQTIIKDSDFSANSDYHVAIENFSRAEWMPTKTGGKATNKWFYERARGQYLDEKSKRTGKELKLFDIEYPKKQKFTKTDLSKYEMSWWQRPYDVGKGAENNFKIFTKELSTEKNEVSKKYYQRLIAKAILFKEIDRIVAKRNLGGYKANMVSYILAWLSYKSNKKLNLDIIWDNQVISESVNNLIEQMIDVVWKHVNTPSKAGMNIGEWCKKQECWLTLKDKFIDTNSINDEIRKDADTYVETDLVGQELSPQESKMIDEAGKIQAEIWFGLSKWAKENNRFTPFDRKLSYNLGVLANRKAVLSPKQAKNGLRILKQAKDEGFE